MTGWIKPENIAYLELKGPDAVRFLNGQISNNVSGDLSKKVVTACVCTMKGKVDAVIRVTAGNGPESLLIEVDKAQEEAVLARLDRYLIADDCEFIESPEVSDVTHIIAESIDHPGAREHWRYGLKGFDVFGEVDTSGLTELELTDLLAQKILHGIPEYGFEISGEEFPASLGLDKWAVDFHKGCYLGQEIVSRIESAGKIPKKLRLFLTTKPYEKGATFSDANGKEIAAATRDSVPHPDQQDTFLTPLLAKDSFAKEGFEEIAILYPPKL
ncbi:MAG: hypothetical protein P1U89_17645 [Verrucomicrobiales bacterium]|nr:hypothetical protein [Verrucomicrobiales bacterium]